MRALKCYTTLVVQSKYTSTICDRIWENPPYGIFCEKRDRNIYQQYVRANLAPSFRSIARSISEICSLLCNDVWTIELEKLQSKCVAMRAHALSVYHECTYVAVGGASLTIDRRSNETSERMATKTARLRPSAASFSRPLEKNSCQPV